MSDQYPPLRPQPPLRQRRRPTPWPMIVGVVFLAVLAGVLALVLIDGGGDPGVSGPGPSGSGAAAAGSTPAEATETATPSPTPSPTVPAPVVAAPEGILPIGSVVEVTADALRMRQAPATSAPVVTSIGAGEVLYLVTTANELGPVETGGFVWYLAMHAPGYRGWPANPPGAGDPAADPRVTGWVAAGSETESFFALAPARCPIGEPEIATIYSMTAWERTACLGDRQLTLEGTFGCAACGGEVPGTFQPDWLAHPINFNIFRPGWALPISVVENMVLRLPPEIAPIGAERGGSILRVTGHFNDPRSVDCVVAPGQPGLERVANDVAAEWYCREQFVVESWEVIGADPAFPSG